MVRKKKKKLKLPQMPPFRETRRWLREAVFLLRLCSRRYWHFFWLRPPGVFLNPQSLPFLASPPLVVSTASTHCPSPCPHARPLWIHTALLPVCPMWSILLFLKCLSPLLPPFWWPKQSTHFSDWPTSSIHTSIKHLRSVCFNAYLPTTLHVLEIRNRVFQVVAL